MASPKHSRRNLTRFLMIVAVSITLFFGTVSAYSAIEPETPTTLVASNSRFWALTLDDSYIYWTDVKARLILKVPKSGGDAMVLASTSSNVSLVIAVFGDFVYWAEQNAATGAGTIKMVPISGGEATTIANSETWGAFNGIRGLAVDSSGVYWTVAGNNLGNNGMIMRISGVPVDNPDLLAQTAPDVLAAGLKNPIGLALNGNNVYWIESDCCGSGGAAKKMGKNGDLPIAIASGLGETSGIATDGVNVFFGIWNGAVHKISVNGGLVSNLGGFTCSQFLAIDDTSVYYTCGDTVSKVSKDGTGHTTLAAGLVSPSGLAVDETGLYWTECPTCFPERGAVKKLPSIVPTPTPTPTPILEPGCDLKITKTQSSDTVFTKENLTYALTVQNQGNQECKGVKVIDRFPDGVNFLIPGFLCHAAARMLVCELGTLRPQEKVSLNIDVRAPDTAGPMTNEAEVRTTSKDVNDANNETSITADVLAEDRDIVFVQGIDSESSCLDENGNGLPDGFVERVEWMKTYLESQEWVKERVNINKFLYFSYGLYCPNGIPLYFPEDTCDGVAKAAGELRDFINGNSSAKVTIIAHSMGGLVAAYMIAAEDEEWVKSHIASVVTFDSPLRGLPRQNRDGLDLGSICDLSDPTRNQSLIDLLEKSDIIQDSFGVALRVPFYTIDATRREFGLGQHRIIEFVPGESTSLDGEKMHQRVPDTHSVIWEEPKLIKQRFVGCGVVVAESQRDCLTDIR